jgi:hypothetical protein
MQFEDFDKKLKQAADQHHPNYDEQAWSRMEKLLDHHLPQEKDGRKRILFILFFVLITGMGFWLAIDQPWKNGKTATTALSTSPGNEDQNPSIQQRAASQEISNLVDGPVTANNERKNSNGNLKNDEQSVSQDNPSTIKSSENGHTTQGSTGNKPGQEIVKTFPAVKVKEGENKFELNSNRPSTGKTKKAKAVLKPTHDPEGGLTKRDKDQTSVPAVNNNEIKESAVNSERGAVITKTDASTPPELKKEDDRDVQEPRSIVKDKAPDKPLDSSGNKVSGEQVAKKSNPAKKHSSLFFTVSAGPDLSSVGFGNPGKIRLLTGVGLGYTFKDKWTLRTGFYAASKVYSAKPSDYKPTVVPPSIDYLTNISADCKVYEIPVELLYNFGRSAKQNFFAGGGLSSFIMKKEVYEYLYVYPGAGQTWTYTHTEDNKNKHYFSVLSLTAGYERKINRVLSLSAAPYLKLPLAGVGYGKVKLNSAGVVLSVKLTPFPGK